MAVSAATSPGPWAVGPHTVSSCWVRDANGRNVADAGYSIYDATDKANCRLIAAAPELLEALQSLLDEVVEPLQADGTIGWKNHSAFARAVIAKATGSAT